MRFFNGSNTKTTKEIIPSVKDLSDETRADIEASLEDGVSPSECVRIYGVSLGVIQSLRRMQIRSRDSKRGTEETRKEDPDPSKQMQIMLMQQIQTAQLQANLDKIKSDNEYEKEKRELELEFKRLELKLKREELYQEEEEEEEEINPAKMLDDTGDINIIGFLTELLKKSPREKEKVEVINPVIEYQAVLKSDPINIPPTIADVTKPLSDEQIDQEIAKATPQDLQMIKNSPVGIIKHGLRQRYPGITNDNLNKIVGKLKGGAV